MAAIPDKYLDLVQQKKAFAQGQISVSPAGRDAGDLREIEPIATHAMG